MNDYRSNLEWALSLLDDAVGTQPAPKSTVLADLRERLLAADERIVPALGHDPGTDRALAEASLRLAREFEHPGHAGGDIAVLAEQLADGWEALGASIGTNRRDADQDPPRRGTVGPWPTRLPSGQQPPAQDARAPAGPVRRG